MRIKRGDALQIILIQVKGGSCRKADGRRRSAIARSRKDDMARVTCSLRRGRKERQARFFRLRRATASEPWAEITNLDSVFR